MGQRSFAFYWSTMWNNLSSISYAWQEAGTERAQAPVTEACIFSVSIIIMKRHLVLLSQFFCDLGAVYTWV